MASLGLLLTIVYVYADDHMQVLKKHAENSNRAAKRPLPSSSFSVGTEIEQPILLPLSQAHHRTLLIRRLFTTDLKVFQQLDNWTKA